MSKVCIVLAPGAEEIETITVADVLVRAGCEVTLAHAESPTIEGSRGIPLTGTMPLDECLDKEWDLLYLPGGVGSAEYCQTEPRVQKLLLERMQAKGLTAIICACPISLLPHGLAQGRKLTCYPGMKGHMVDGGADWQDAAVVRDGHLITSQGPGTAMTLALTLATMLKGEATATEVAEGMLLELPSLAKEIAA